MDRSEGPLTPKPPSIPSARGGTRLDEAALVLVCAIWGSTFVVVGGLMAQVPPVQLLVARFVLGAALLAGLSGRRFREAGKGIGRGGVVLGLWLAAGFGLQTVGLAYTTPARAAFITGFCVVLPPIIGALLQRRLPAFPTLAAALAAGLGVGIIAWPGRGEPVNAGDVLTGLCAIAYGAHIYATGLYAPRFRAEALTAVQVAVAAVVFVAAGALALAAIQLSPGAPPAWAAALAGRPCRWTLPITTAILYLTLFATVLAYYLQTHSQRRVSPARAGFIFALEPVFAAVISTTLGRDALTWRLAAGGLLVVAGILLSTEESGVEEVEVPA